MRRVKAIVAAALLLGTSATLNAALIDGFTQGAFTVNTPGNTVNGTNVSGADAIAGSRAISLEDVENNPATASLTSGGPLSVTGSLPYLTLGYGLSFSGGGMAFTHDLDANFTNSDGLIFNFKNATASILILLSIETNGGSGFLTNDNPGDHTFIAPSGTGQFVIPYSSLQNVGADLSHVSFIDLNFEVQGNFSITQISTEVIPEPAMLMPLALVAAGLRRRRS